MVVVRGEEREKKKKEEEKEKRDETKKKSGREKRREFIGMAKAVDRGQWSAVYAPGGNTTGLNFESKSGLPPHHKTKPFTVLGVESSCDDTGAAVVRSDGKILGEALASQHHIHEEFGGVVPGLAKSAHEREIDGVIALALERAGMGSAAEVDAVGVTVGPGLEICLRVGCRRASDIAVEFGKPFVAVHHLEAHILMARIPAGDGDGDGPTSADVSSDRAMEFPFLALLVSGGHCQILKCLGVGRYSIIGGTMDDSLGEAYDKVGRMLGLPVGGGGRTGRRGPGERGRSEFDTSPYTPTEEEAGLRLQLRGAKDGRHAPGRAARQGEGSGDGRRVG